MKLLFRIICTTLFPLLLAVSLHARSEEVAPIISDAWVKTTVPGGNVSAAYFSVKSTRPLKLVKAESPVAGIVEIHNMNMKDGVMEMKSVDAVDIPANKTVELKPGGLHVMLMKVGKPINTRDMVPLLLTFEGADKKPIVVKLDAVAREKAPPSTKH